MKFPDCESPIAMAWAISPAAGLLRADRVGRVVAEERDDVARRGQPDREHQRILGGVDQFVQPGGIEAVLHADARRVGHPRVRGRTAVGERPSGTRHDHGAAFDAGRALTREHRQGCPLLIETGRRIHRWAAAHRAQSDRQGGRAGRDVVEPGQDRTGHRRAVGVPCYGNGNRLIRRGRHDIALPAADQHDVPVGVRRHVTFAAVDDLVDQHARGLRGIDRPRQRERRHVLDTPTRVTRCELQVLDDAVVRIAGIHFAVHPAAHDFVRARAAAGLYRRRPPREDLEPYDLAARLGREAAEYQQSHCQAGAPPLSRRGHPTAHDDGEQHQDRREAGEGEHRLVQRGVAAAHVKLSAASGLPTPLKRATLGNAHSGRERSTAPLLK